MQYIKVKCINADCAVKDATVTIPAGRPLAPGVTEKLGDLICDECGQGMWTEPVG